MPDLQAAPSPDGWTAGSNSWHLWYRASLLDVYIPLTALSGWEFLTVKIQPDTA